MRFNRLPVKDPRTVARDIPGICDLLFPQLLPSIVTYLNRQAKEIPNCKPVSAEFFSKASASAAMLFEIANARVEQILNNEICENWDSCMEVALRRQSKYFDAELPDALTEHDLGVIRVTSSNLVVALRIFENQQHAALKSSPEIPGYQWISNGHGDFSIGNTLIEVKCGSKNFGSPDYRQLLIYWLLSFAGVIEDKSQEWTTAILINPRLNKYIQIEFNELIGFSAAGLSKIEVLELFESIVSDYSMKIDMRHK